MAIAHQNRPPPRKDARPARGGDDRLDLYRHDHSERRKTQQSKHSSDNLLHLGIGSKDDADLKDHGGEDDEVPNHREDSEEVDNPQICIAG